MHILRYGSSDIIYKSPIEYHVTIARIDNQETTIYKNVNNLCATFRLTTTKQFIWGFYNKLLSKKKRRKV